jgi:thiosulfate reductase cytochrome b subunit
MRKTGLYLYSKFERFWHWTQMFLVVLMVLTGFEVHGNYSLFGYENSVRIHSSSAWTFMGLALLSIFWMFVTKQYKNFIPSKENLKEQVRYYMSGILKGEVHPIRKSLFNKLNPLQKIVYFGLLIFIFPVQILTGIAYMFYHYPQNPIDAKGFEIAVYTHTLGAFAVVAFIIVHVYMTTTGQTIASNLKAMISGYEQEEEHNEKIENQENIIVNESNESEK